MIKRKTIIGLQQQQDNMSRTCRFKTFLLLLIQKHYTSNGIVCSCSRRQLPPSSTTLLLPPSVVLLLVSLLLLDAKLTFAFYRPYLLVLVVRQRGWLQHVRAAIP